MINEIKLGSVIVGVRKCNNIHKNKSFITLQLDKLVKCYLFIYLFIYFFVFNDINVCSHELIMM